MLPIRLGVIGLGLIWVRTHQRILESFKDTFLPVAFCDVSEERRAAIAQEFPNAPVVSDYDRLLALPEVDAVLVLTPLTLNAPVARAALQAGKHVIMEKPVARSVAEGQELAAIAQCAGKRLLVAEQLGYRQFETRLAELIAGGMIGELVLWERVQHFEADTAQGAMRYDSTPWRKQANFPLGTMFDGGIHLIASLSKTFGIPASVSATGKQLRPEYGDYDHIAALFQYANGSTGMLSYSSYLAPLQNHYRIYGSTGALYIERNQITVEKPGQEVQVIEVPAENAYLSMWQAFAAAFQSQNEPFYTPERAVHDVAILEAVAQSIKSGERVQINSVPV